MKAIFTILCILSISSISLTGQLDNGAMIPINIRGIDVLNSEPINVQDWLDDDKAVIINFFASWCSQCWDYKESQWLNELYKTFGPEGTDEIRILGIESEELNGPENIVMEVSGVRPYKSYGDWTESVDYPIIDDASFNQAFNLELIPAIYIVRPQGQLIELNRNSALYDMDFQMKAIFPKKNDIMLSGNIKDASFCSDYTIPEGNLNILNMGQDPIEEMTLDFYIGQSLVQSIYLQEEVGPLASINIDTDEQLINSDADVNIFVSNINGVTFPISQNNLINTEIIEPVLNTEKLKMKITFDQYPAETQWILRTDNFEEIARGNYSANEVEPWATLDYEFDIPLDATCLTLTLEDSYGDGWIKWGIDENGVTTPVPGIEFYNQYDVKIKNKHSIENTTNFSTDLESIDIFIKRDALSDTKEILNQIEVFPSPTSEFLTIDGIQDLQAVSSITITDLLGKTLISLDKSEISKTISVGQLYPGTYMVNIRRNQEVTSKIFVKN